MVHTVLSMTQKGSTFSVFICNKEILLNKSVLVVSGLLLCFALLAGGVFLVSKSQAQGSAEFSVANMTCGSCASKINAALAKLPGVGEVQVNVGGGTATVAYTEGKVTPDALAQAISTAGFPATVRQVLTAAEVQTLAEDASRLSARFIARIGDRLISREEFDGELARRLGGAGGVNDPAQRQALWQELQERELLLGAAQKQGIIVQQPEVERQIELMRGGLANFDQMIETRFGGLEAFARKVREDMTIRRTLEEGVLKGMTDQAQRQQALNAWYQQLVASTPVLLLDPALKAAVGGKGCGGGCCG